MELVVRPLDRTLTVPPGANLFARMSLLTESCEIEVPEPDEVVVHPARVLKASVVAVEDMTHDIKRIVLRPAKPLSFSPGQYAQVQFSPNHIRPYSMARLPSDEELEFHVRLVLRFATDGGGRHTASQTARGTTRACLRRRVLCERLVIRRQSHA